MNPHPAFLPTGDDFPEPYMRVFPACSGPCGGNPARCKTPAACEVANVENVADTHRVPRWLYAAGFMAAVVGSYFYPWGFA